MDGGTSWHDVHGNVRAGQEEEEHYTPISTMAVSLSPAASVQ